MLNKGDLLEPPGKVTWAFCCAVTQSVMVAQQCHFRGGAELHQGAKSLNPPSEVQEAHLPVLSGTAGGQLAGAALEGREEVGERGRGGKGLGSRC